MNSPKRCVDDLNPLHELIINPFSQVSSKALGDSFFISFGTVGSFVCSDSKSHSIFSFQDHQGLVDLLGFPAWIQVIVYFFFRFFLLFQIQNYTQAEYDGKLYVHPESILLLGKSDIRRKRCRVKVIMIMSNILKVYTQFKWSLHHLTQ